MSFVEQNQQQSFQLPGKTHKEPIHMINPALHKKTVRIWHKSTNKDFIDRNITSP